MEWRKYLAVLFVFICGSFSCAQETIPLTEYLQRAIDSGIRIVYSSNLISPQFTVTIDPQKTITPDEIERLIRPFDLSIESLNPVFFTVVRTELPADTETKPVVETTIDPGTDATEPAIEEIIVTASLFRLLVHDGDNSSTLEHDQLVERPAIGNDVVRLVNQLPGSASVGLSAKPYVRGGNENETLIEYDGIRLYDPFHFNNYNALFGIFDNRIVDSMDFHSGGFGTKYGDSLSAAMIVHTIDPDDLGELRELGVGLYNISYLQAHQENNRDWLVNARRSSFELAASMTEQDLGTPTFADFFGRHGWTMDNGDRITLNLFWFGDDMKLNNSTATESSNSYYNNTYIWLNSENSLTANLNSRSTLSFTTSKNRRNGAIEKPDFATGALSDKRQFRIIGLKQDLGYIPSDKWAIGFGWGYGSIKADYDFYSTLSIDPAFQQLSNYARPELVDTALTLRGHQYSLYSSIKWALSDKLITEAGLRFDAHNYSHSNKSEQLDPRVNIRYRLTDKSILRFGWGQYSQAEGIHEIKLSDGLRDVQPVQSVDQLVLGLDQNLPAGLNLRVEAYQKRGKETGVYFQNLTNTLSLVPDLHPDRYLVSPDGFESQGVELTLTGKWRELNFWANYSYSSVKDEISGESIRRSWDQTHAGNLGLSTTLYNWQIAFTGSSHKGWLTTSLNFENGEVTTGRRNNTRFNRYISWDFKLIREWNTQRGQLRVEAGLTNLLGRKNQIGIEYEVINGELVAQKDTGLPLAPFVDLFWQF